MTETAQKALKGQEIRNYLPGRIQDVCSEGALVVCDVNGTLISPAGPGNRNEDLLKLLIDLKNNGAEVVIASNDPYGTNVPMLKLLLKRLGEDEGLFEIQNKSSLRERHAALVFDDDQPDYLAAYDVHIDVDTAENVAALRHTISDPEGGILAQLSKEHGPQP